MNGNNIQSTTTRNNKSNKLHRFLCCFNILILTVLGFSRIRTTTLPSLNSYNDGCHPSSNQKTRDNEESSGTAFSDIMPQDWRGWLDSNNNATEIMVDDMKPPSQHTKWGCGISMQLLFQKKRTKLEPIPSQTKAFFKVSYSDMSHYDAETHLREIKAYYLDRILKTNVVLPCIGYHLDRQQMLLLDGEKNWDFIQEQIKCIHEKKDDVVSKNDDHETTVAQGSIMLWMNDLEQVRKETIVKKAKLFFNSSTSATTTTLQEEQESAMNYALFHYLGACMKSDHNHFSHREKTAGGDDYNNFSRHYIAIDNDRCMTPKAIFSNREVVPDIHFDRIQLWEKLVYRRICQASGLPVLQVVREAAAASRTDNPVNNSGLISNRLFKALETDVLYDELIKEQPEAFLEIDERINKLDEYIRKNCPQQQATS